MVSLQKYMKTYIYVMPERIKKLKKSMKYKRENLDPHFISGDRSSDLKSEWFEIVGKNKIFRSAEKSKKQSIKRQIWKLQKSLGLFPKFIENIEKFPNMDPKMISAKNTLIKVLSHGTDYRKILLEFDSSLKRQGKYLDQPGNYKAESDFQKALFISIDKSKKDIVAIQKSAAGLLQRYNNKEISNNFMDGFFSLSIGFGFAFFTIGCLNVVAGSFGLDPVLIPLAGQDTVILSLFLIAVSNVALFINSLDKYVITIVEFVRESI